MMCSSEAESILLEFTQKGQAIEMASLERRMGPTLLLCVPLFLEDT